MQHKKKLVRITTVPISLKVLLRKQLAFMSHHFKVLAVSSPGKTLEEVKKDEGVQTAAVNMTRAITPIADAKALWQLYRLLKKEKPLIVHTHTPKAGLLGMTAAKMAGVPIRLHTVAGMPLMEATGKKRTLLEKIETLTYACATKVYPNSRNMASFIVQHKYCKADKLKVIGNGSSNGIDTDYFATTPALTEKATRLKQSLGITDDSFVFVFIGRLVRDKGIEEMVSAFSKLKKRHGHLKLLLVGPFEPKLDPISAQTMDVIDEDNDIIQVGFQQDVRPYYAISHALAFPSYREGFPNVPMQAGCFHLPSIVTDINGCNEIIEHGTNGLIIPPKNETALQAAMETLITDKALYVHLKNNARASIVTNYDQKHFWQLLLQEYQHHIKQYEAVS